MKEGMQQNGSTFNKQSLSPDFGSSMSLDELSEWNEIDQITTVNQVVDWFRLAGPEKNWVYGGKEQLLRDSLLNFANGIPTDFLIWNCIGFRWFAKPNGEFPSCTINNNLDASITVYFQERIKETMEILSSLGNPAVTVLIPSNEAFDARVWEYQQSEEEREDIINDAVSGLSERLSALELPATTSLSVKRWDDFLKDRGASRAPVEYSLEGENRLKNLPQFSKKILPEGIRSGRSYLAKNGIDTITDEALAKRQPQYYGVYAGEGVAFEELKKNGNNIIVINFEEMRVPKMAYLGAKEDLPIVSPVTNDEREAFYRSETRKIQKRYED